MAAIGRTLVVAYTVAWLLFLLFILLGGYVLTKGKVLVTSSSRLSLQGQDYLLIPVADTFCVRRCSLATLHPFFFPGSQHSWMIGGYWSLPLGWLTNAIFINEFSAPRWGDPYVYDPSVSKSPSDGASRHTA